MNTELLWELIQKNGHHIEVINRELGTLIAQVDWLTWMVRGVIIGIALNVMLLVVNIWLTKRNGKKS